MSSLMIKSLVFSAILMIATVAVIMNLNIDIFADSVTSITMAGALAIAVLTSAISAKYMNQMKTDKATGELCDDNWDGIGEYENELPSGWAYSFLALFIWSMWYGFLGYPVNSYSQIGEYNEEVLAYNAKFEEKHKNADEDTLRDMGESIFLVQCQQCHGATGDGLSGRAEDFTKNRSSEDILAIINIGQNALDAFPAGMPAGMLSGEMAKEVSVYIADGFKGTQPASYASCAGCHGTQGEGVAMVGPRINGYDMTNTLAKGKKGLIGRMPAFSTIITPVQEKALTVYVQSLAN